MQPYGLNKIARELQSTFTNYQKIISSLKLKNYRLNLNSRTHIVGIINLTPDSFSGDGLLPWTGDAAEYARKLADDGADILDIGAESSRSGPGRFR